MALEETGVDTEFRQRVIAEMSTILMQLLGRDEPVTEQMRLMDELNVNSLLALELLLRLEEQLEIQINVESLDPDRMVTVGDLATFIAGHHRSM
ncbi:MAG TPA: phosphopantetheine-binding protein [Jatrophihabitans sp.]|nr:phosphopantetheine-binding protein [Jatrophihabitans sp.]